MRDLNPMWTVSVLDENAVVQNTYRYNDTTSKDIQLNHILTEAKINDKLKSIVVLDDMLNEHTIIQIKPDGNHVYIHPEID